MLELGFYTLQIVLLIFIYMGVSRVLQKIQPDALKRKKSLISLSIGLSLWIGYVALLSSTGFLADFSLPPKMPIFTILPALLFIFIFLRHKKSQTFISATPLSWLTYMQSFRIFVELLLWWSFIEGLLPPEVTLEGYNLDIIVGLTAPAVGYLCFTKKTLPKMSIIIWNISSILVLGVVVFTFMTVAFAPHIWGHEVSKIIGMPYMPYILVACFWMPFAFFMHFMSLKKLFNKS